jgi:predicted component of type VI protein secretion system
MNYVLHVVKGRAETGTIRLVDGVNSIGRHDDCLIRIRSSQVSRRHCELLEDGGALIVRDLGSSNGTYVNGNRVLGQQRLSPGDVLTVGGVSLRVELLDAAAPPQAGTPGPKAADTAELEAVPDAHEAVEFQDEEFEIAIEEETEHLDLIPLDDEPSPPKPPATPKPAAASGTPGRPDPEPAKKEPGKAPGAQSTADEEAAVAQFLMDLKLDEEE